MQWRMKTKLASPIDKFLVHELSFVFSQNYLEYWEWKTLQLSHVCSKELHFHFDFNEKCQLWNLEL
jgi:hypothetical protein